MRLYFITINFISFTIFFLTLIGHAEQAQAQVVDDIPHVVAISEATLPLSFQDGDVSPKIRSLIASDLTLIYDRASGGPVVAEQKGIHTRYKIEFKEASENVPYVVESNFGYIEKNGDITSYLVSTELSNAYRKGLELSSKHSEEITNFYLFLKKIKEIKPADIKEHGVELLLPIFIDRKLLPGERLELLEFLRGAVLFKPNILNFRTEVYGEERLLVVRIFVQGEEDTFTGNIEFIFHEDKWKLELVSGG